MRRIGKRVASSLIMAALLAGVASALTLAIGDPISGRRGLVGAIASLLAYLRSPFLLTLSSTSPRL